MVKIITGIREPIGRDLSTLYQNIASASIAPFFTKETMLAFFHQNDVQTLFEDFISYKSEGTTCIRTFFDTLQICGIDVRNHPFDQEKGYGICKEGPFEIFVYQLEKLNDLVPEISQWMGYDFDCWEKTNEASEKWVAKSYEKAKKELTFSQEYFDACYADSYVQHCYTPEDIEKFKTKWKSHIR